MKNKKGFTLIELLAVIVILAVIALIAVPIVLNMINSARKSAAKSSALGFIDAIEYNNGLSEIENSDYTLFEDGTYTSLKDFKDIKMKGKKPDSLNLTITNKKVVSAELCINDYKAIYDGKEVKKLIKGCDSEIVDDEDSPTPENPPSQEPENPPVEEDKTPTEYEKDKNPYFVFDFDNATNDSLNNIAGDQNYFVAKNISVSKKGVVFNGSNSYIELGRHDDKVFTYEASIIVTRNQSNSVIIGNLENGGCAIHLSDNTTKKYMFGECYIDGSYKKVYANEQAQFNKLYNLTLSYDGSNLKFYVNGELNDTQTYNSEIKSPEKNTSLMIGANPNGTSAASEYFNGLILSARYYQEALTDEEVKNNSIVTLNKYKDLVDTLPNSYNEITKDGLLVHYDSKFNTRIGYVNKYNSLDNLVSTSYDTTLKNMSIDNNEMIFNGSSSYVPIGAINTPNITYEVLFKQEEYKSSTENIISNLESGGCAIYTISNALYGQCYIGGAYRKITYNSFPLNEYILVSLTYDGNDLKLYVNGNLEGTYSNSSGIKYPSYNTILMLGNNPTGSSSDIDFFKGKIKSTRVYNKALTDTEILNNYNTDKKIHSELK